MSEYTARDWQNGKPCPQHELPYCTPCFKALVSMSGENPYKTALIGSSENAMQSFYRPKATRNFFLDSRRRRFAASCQLADDTFLVVPLEFVIVGDADAAHKADDDETRAILTKEHLWDISTPEWMQQDVTLKLNDEDEVLLREFQLFKS